MDQGGMYMWGLLRRSLKQGRVTKQIANTKQVEITDIERIEIAKGDAANKRLLPVAFNGSLQVRHLDCGSCNGCDWEMSALLNPVYDLQRFGIDFVASPRHADALLCTGPVSTHLVQAALATYEAMPSPKIVVAIGDCAINGGVFRGGYAVGQGTRGILPVALEIPGCPPEPEDIIRALVQKIGCV